MSFRTVARLAPLIGFALFTAAILIVYRVTGNPIFATISGLVSAVALVPAVVMIVRCPQCARPVFAQDSHSFPRCCATCNRELTKTPWRFKKSPMLL